MLGGFAIRVEGQLAHVGLGASGRLMAAYLFTFPSQIHRKERIADLFWPDFNEKTGRHAFNTALWRLRRLLDHSDLGSSIKLISVGGEIVLEAEDTTLIDVHRFQELATQCLGTQAKERDRTQLRAATSVYKGPFLDGESDDWVLVERERLHCLYVRCLEGLMRLFAQAASYEDALACGRDVLTIDPLRESVQRSVMLLYVLNGQRAEAIHQFNRCRDLLRSECDVEPMPQTEQLDALIRSGTVFDQLDTLSESILSEGVGARGAPLVP